MRAMVVASLRFHHQRERDVEVFETLGLLFCPGSLSTPSELNSNAGEEGENYYVMCKYSMLGRAQPRGEVNCTPSNARQLNEGHQSQPRIDISCTRQRLKAI